MSRDLSGVLDSVLAGVVVVDDSGRIELANAAACRMLERSEESMVESSVDEAFGAEHALAALAREVLKTGRSAVQGERPIPHRFDEDLVVDVTCSPLFDSAGGIDGAVLVLRDRTIQKDLEKLISEREHLSAFGRIAAGVAHEVKNPLGGIRGAAEILASRASDAKTHDAAELIVREVDRIAALVDDLMVFTHGESIRSAPLNIHRVLDGVIALVEMDPLGASIAIERHYDPSIPDLLADGDRLTQVFLNLTRNSLQAMEGGAGTLSIKTRLDFDHRLSAASGNQRPPLVVEVADTGPGISPSDLEQLAVPFFSTRPGGTGLGLAVSRHWVARHGGSLRIYSTTGEGTRVRVSLPLRTPS